MNGQALAAQAMSGRSSRFRGAYFAQNKKRRPFGEDRRLICSSCSRLPRDHPPCGTPVPEGTLLVSECLYHKPPASATNSTRLALGPAGQDQDPPGAPVEGGANKAAGASVRLHQLALDKQERVVLSGHAAHLRGESTSTEEREDLSAPRLAPGDAAGLLHQVTVDVRADRALAPLDLAEQDRIGLLVEAHHVDLRLVVPPVSDAVQGEREAVAPSQGLAGDPLVRPTEEMWQEILDATERGAGLAQLQVADVRVAAGEPEGDERVLQGVEGSPGLLGHLLRDRNIPLDQL